MKNNFVRMSAGNEQIICKAIDSTAIVTRAHSIHGTSNVASAALGRLLTAASLMGVSLKDEESLTLRLSGGGPLGTLLAVSDSFGNVRGTVQHPVVNLPLKDNGKLNVGEAVGTSGALTVIKDLGLKDPYVGQVPLVSGEIAEDITAYFATSEQLPTVCALGVLCDADGTRILNAGGFLIQLLPGATEETIEKVEEGIKGIRPVTELLSIGMTPEEILREALPFFSLNLLEESHTEYRCNCSRDRVEKALFSLGSEELLSLADEEETEVCCQFCPRKYKFTQAEIKKLASEIKK